MTPSAYPDLNGLLATSILVVESEVIPRLLLADHLRTGGYKVIEAGSAGEAMQILRADVPVDVVFSDVRTPGELNGLGLSQWVREHKPEVQVILTSGEAGAAGRANRLCATGPLLPKPYDPAWVLRVIRRQLGDGRAAS